MNVLLLHGSGWDEFLLIGVTLLIGFLVVRFTMRPSDEPGDSAGVASSDDSSEASSTKGGRARREAGAAHDENP
jgi:hypothetical protein